MAPPSIRLRLAVLGALALLASLVVVIAPGHAAATTVSVATEAEYRAALTSLGSDPSGPHTIILTADITFAQSGDGVYAGTEELTIDGAGFTIDANRKGRALRADAAPKVTIRDVTITGGQGGQSGACCGGVWAVVGDLDIIGSVLVDNRTAGNGDGGAAGARGNLTLIDSAVVGNFGADDTGGVVANRVVAIGSTIADNTAAGFRGEGAGIFGNEVVIINSTVSGNRLTNGNGGQGGGGIMSRGPLTLVYATVIGNDGPAGRGENIRVWDRGNGNGMSSFGSVVAYPGGSASCLIDGPTTSSYSYDDDGSCGFVGVGDTSGGSDPLLGPLADNGGSTPTHLPDPASPLVDAIAAGACDPVETADQRGIARPQGPGCDIGAVEVEVPNEPPVCSAAAASVDTIWPPDHRLVDIDVLGVTDPDGDAVTTTVVSIFQDEPTDGLGDGDTAPDGFGLGTPTATVRAERAGNGDGRVYHVGFTADDGQGGSCSGEVLVGVPKSQWKKGGPVDGGPLFDSTVG